MKLTRAQLLAENVYLRDALNNQEKSAEHWKKKYQERLDVQMMEQRIKLASQVGQLVEAASKAVMFIVGKEVM